MAGLESYLNSCVAQTFRTHAIHLTELGEFFFIRVNLIWK